MILCMEVGGEDFILVESSWRKRLRGVWGVRGVDVSFPWMAVFSRRFVRSKEWQNMLAPGDPVSLISSSVKQCDKIWFGAHAPLGAFLD